MVRSYTDCTYHGPLTGATWARNIKAPGRSTRRHPHRFQSLPSKFCPPHLNVFISEKVLYKSPVNSGHARVMNSKAIGQQVLQLQVLGSRQRTGEAVSLPEGTLPERKQISSAKTLPLAQPTETQPPGSPGGQPGRLGLSRRAGRSGDLGPSLLTLHCSASVRRTSVEAEPSLRNRPSVSFSRHMSRMALAVFPVSFRECTTTST